MRKPSKNVARNLYEQAERNAWINQIALTLAVTTGPDARERIRLDDDTYTLSLYGAHRADGGIVVVRFSHQGQNDSVMASYFDEYARDWHERVGQTPTATAFAAACERLQSAVARSPVRVIEMWAVR